MDSLVERLREKGLKVTPQRVAIYGLLLNTTAHPTAEELWEEVKKDHAAVSFNTVYTTLSTLAQAGLIQRLHMGAAAHYDAKVSPHVHLNCRQCGRVDDYDADFGLNLAAVGSRAKRDRGFVAERLDLTVYGICLPCSKISWVQELL